MVTGNLIKIFLLNNKQNNSSLIDIKNLTYNLIKNIIIVILNS